MASTVRSWLSEFEKAVSTRNYQDGLKLYSKESTIFGTRVNWSEDIEEYLENQWKIIWESSSNYKFTQVLDTREDNNLIMCVTLWTNNTLINGTEVKREGRATFVLERVNGELLAIHSHYSEFPEKR